MHVRLTYMKFLPGMAEQARKIYYENVVGTLKKQKGLLECKLLEPLDKSGDYISLTSWQSMEDAQAYEASGLYKELVDQVKDLYSQPPVLRSFNAKEVMQTA